LSTAVEVLEVCDDLEDDLVDFIGVGFRAGFDLSLCKQYNLFTDYSVWHAVHIIDYYNYSQENNKNQKIM
jgi:hypothetical protein